MLGCASSLLLMLLLLASPTEEASGKDLRIPPAESHDGNRKSKQQPIPTIRGGTRAPCGRYPYMAALVHRETFEQKCGGVLIHPSWILTAAHCLDPEGPLGPQPIIFVGACDLRDVMNGLVEKFNTPADIIIHEKWKNLSLGNDLALLKLPQDSGRPVITLPLNSIEVRMGQVVVAAGWGDEDDGGPAPPYLKQATKLQVLGHTACSRSKNWGPIFRDSMLCVAVNDEDICYGDSGGPLLIANAPDANVTAGDPQYDLLIGIASFGDGQCGEKVSQKPSVFTAVAEFADWIMEKIGSLPPLPKPKAEEDKDLISKSPSPIIPKDGKTSSPNPDDNDGSPPTSGPLPPPTECTRTGGDSSECKGLQRALMNAFFNDYGTLIVENPCCTLAVFDGGWTLLHYAARNPKIPPDVVEHIIDSGADVNAAIGDGKRPVHMAARSGNVGAIKVLAGKGADLNAIDIGGRTAIHEATIERRYDAITVLVDEGADVNAVEGEETAMHLAARLGDEQAIDVLAADGGSVDARDAFNETPLHLAAKNGHVKAVVTLMKYNANSAATDAKGETPCDDVCEKECPPDAASKIKISLGCK